MLNLFCPALREKSGRFGKWAWILKGRYVRKALKRDIKLILGGINPLRSRRTGEIPGL